MAAALVPEEPKVLRLIAELNQTVVSQPSHRILLKRIHSRAQQPRQQDQAKLKPQKAPTFINYVR